MRSGRIRDYAPIFRDLTRWSLLGVVFTEVTVNAHAYLVTFIAGPGAFALLALGMLLMRPALAGAERPARPGAAGDDPRHRRGRLARRWSRIQREFLVGLLAVWTRHRGAGGRRC